MMDRAVQPRRLSGHWCMYVRHPGGSSHYVALQYIPNMEFDSITRKRARIQCLAIVCMIVAPTQRPQDRRMSPSLPKYVSGSDCRSGIVEHAQRWVKESEDC